MDSKIDVDEAPVHGIVMPRLFAMAERCRNKGGDCPCGMYCKAETELARAESELSKQLRKVQHKLKWLRHKPCTVRDEWERPEPPEGDYTLTVINEGDGWCLHWYSETEKEDYVEISGDAAWPFVEDTAWDEDWERLGVAVV